MEVQISSIHSMETLILTLRKFIRLNRQKTLTKPEERLKNAYEAEIIEFLNNLENNTRRDSTDNKPNYSMESVSKFISYGCIPYLSEEDEIQYDKAVGFRDKLNELMKKKGVKSKEIIEETGLNQSVFSKVKVGIRPPSKEVAEALTKYFKYDFNQYV